ncbi:MAG: hypothetical protein M3310_02105, partial [Actinomycetota bacterium]|nr:hypothetical protein [Actinomycetota bacterium]
MPRAIVCAAVAALLLAAPAGPSARAAPGCPATLASQIRPTGSATQLITVVSQHRAATSASLQLWRK